jgi:hypothetical protein
VFAQPGDPLIDATSTLRVVTVALDISRETLIKQGDAVMVTLPDSSATAGSIGSIGAVATANPSAGGQPGQTTVLVTITLADPTAGGRLDQAPVIVTVTDTVHHAVLAVPVTALIAQPGGEYAVEVVAGGQRHVVTVTTGLFDDRGLVEVTSSDLHEGDMVEVPQT